MRKWLKNVANKIVLSKVLSKGLPDEPFGKRQILETEEYETLHRKEKGRIYRSIDRKIQDLRYEIDKDFFESLALKTQVVSKKGELCYQHGRLLYAYLRKYAEKNKGTYITVLETGTARGFSAVCMSKALNDSNVNGHIVTVDCISHDGRIYWNCIEDKDGPRSRGELLSDWASEVQRIVFLRGWTSEVLNNLGLERVGFAFLDCQHDKESVLSEFEYISKRQEVGDQVFFDDATPGVFPGVVKAIETIEKQGDYKVEWLKATDMRGYAIGTRVRP